MSLRKIAQLSGCRRLLPVVLSNQLKNDIFLSRYSRIGTTLKVKCFDVQKFSTQSPSQLADDPTKIATYEEIKDLPNHLEKLLIDVREPQELKETGVIPTSINIPLKTVTENLELSPNDFLEKFKRQKPWPQTEVIFTCRSGKRAGNLRGDACEMATQLGFKNVKNYKGSWLDWAKREGLDM